MVGRTTLPTPVYLRPWNLWHCAHRLDSHTGTIVVVGIVWTTVHFKLSLQSYFHTRVCMSRPLWLINITLAKLYPRPLFPSRVYTSTWNSMQYELTKWPLDQIIKPVRTCGLEWLLLVGAAIVLINYMDQPTGLAHMYLLRRLSVRSA